MGGESEQCLVPLYLVLMANQSSISSGFSSRTNELLCLLTENWLGVIDGTVGGPEAVTLKDFAQYA